MVCAASLISGRIFRGPVELEPRRRSVSGGHTGGRTGHASARRESWTATLKPGAWRPRRRRRAAGRRLPTGVLRPHLPPETQSEPVTGSLDSPMRKGGFTHGAVQRRLASVRSAKTTPRPNRIVTAPQRGPHRRSGPAQVRSANTWCWRRCLPQTRYQCTSPARRRAAAAPSTGREK